MARPERPTTDAPGALARLDERVVPSLQRGARRAARVLAAPLRVLGRWEERVAGGRPLRFAARNRQLVLLVAVTIAAAGSFVHLLRYPEIRDARRASELAGREQTVREPTAPVDVAGDGVGTVGPVLGRSLDDYVDERREALVELGADAERLAVVSFDEYVTPEAVADVLPEGVRIRFAQYRIPAEGERPLETEVVRDDLVGSVDRAVEAVLGPILTEIEEAERLIDSGSVEDEAFLEDLRRRVSELEAVRNLLDSTSRVVFAVVVEADGETLRTLAEADGVRLVDVAEEPLDASRSSFFGLVPEDRERATFGS